MSQAAFAQWSDNSADNTAVCTEADNQHTATAVSDDAGGVIIAWRDYRDGISYDIYAQRLNAAGIAQWPSNGVPVCTVPNSQGNPQIASDGAGGAIITWEEYRDGVSSDIYAQRINAAGIVQWTSNGVVIYNGRNEQDPDIVSDGAGGAIIAWDHGSDINVHDIYAQRINAAGTVQWTPGGAVICTSANTDLTTTTLVSDGAGGAIITWQDYRDGVDYNIYAQRINAAGIVQWAINGKPICTAADFQYDPVIASDNAGGAIIAWEDYRDGIANVYAQRVNAEGIVQWVANGVATCTATGGQNRLAIISDGAGGAIITWQDLRNGDLDIYAQRLNSAGAVRWTANGAAICITADFQGYPIIAPSGVGGAIIAWMDRRGDATDVYAQSIAAAGSTEWAVNGVTISTATGDQYSPVIVSDGAGGAIIAWEDNRNGGPYDIYAQNVKVDGTPGCTVPSITDQPLATQTICKNAIPANLTVMAKGDGLTYQWYSDNNNLGFNGNPVSGKTNSSFTPPTGTAGTFYYYVIVTGTCGKDTSCYAKITINPSFTWFQDTDLDGYGNPSVTKKSCTRPSGYVADHTDCNDRDKKIHSPLTYFRDYDKDGYGDPTNTKCVCSSSTPSGYVKDHTDCNDRDKKIHSSQTYYRDYDKDGYGDPYKTICVCSSVAPAGYVKDHTDCNDHDKNIHSLQTYYKDYDKDGYGDADSKTFACSFTPPYGYVKNRTDCNDHNKNVHPGAREIAGNYVDDNCNGKRDEKTSLARGGDDNTVDDEPGNLLNITDELKVNALPNPSPNYFTINIRGSYKPAELRVMDITGRLVEVKSNITTNSTLTIGHNYRPGVYLVEVMQGSERVVIKCIKQ